jgi:hypothetical protein
VTLGLLWCVTILDHGINVDEIPEPHRLAERGW